MTTIHHPSYTQFTSSTINIPHKTNTTLILQHKSTPTHPLTQTKPAPVSCQSYPKQTLFSHSHNPPVPNEPPALVQVEQTDAHNDYCVGHPKLRPRTFYYSLSPFPTPCLSDPHYLSRLPQVRMSDHWLRAPSLYRLTTIRGGGVVLWWRTVMAMSIHMPVCSSTD